MKAQGQTELYVLEFLNSALDIGQWSASRCSRLTPVEEVFVPHCVQTLMGFKIELVDLERGKFLPHPGITPIILGRSGRKTNKYRPLCASGQWENS